MVRPLKSQKLQQRADAFERYLKPKLSKEQLQNVKRRYVNGDLFRRGLHNSLLERNIRIDNNPADRGVFVFGLESHITKKFFFDAFRVFGEIQDCRIYKPHGTTCGYGFVFFRTTVCALMVVKNPTMKIGDIEVGCCLVNSMDCSISIRASARKRIALRKRKRLLQEMREKQRMINKLKNLANELNHLLGPFAEKDSMIGNNKFNFPNVTSLHFAACFHLMEKATDELTSAVRFLSQSRTLMSNRKQPGISTSAENSAVAI